MTSRKVLVYFQEHVHQKEDNMIQKRLMNSSFKSLQRPNILKGICKFSCDIRVEVEIFTEPVLVTSHSRNHRASGHLEFDMTFRSLKEHAQLFFF